MPPANGDPPFAPCPTAQRRRKLANDHLSTVVADPLLTAQPQAPGGARWPSLAAPAHFFHHHPPSPSSALSFYLLLPVFLPCRRAGSLTPRDLPKPRRLLHSHPSPLSGSLASGLRLRFSLLFGLVVLSPHIGPPHRWPTDSPTGRRRRPKSPARPGKTSTLSPETASIARSSHQTFVDTSATMPWSVLAHTRYAMSTPPLTHIVAWASTDMVPGRRWPCDTRILYHSIPKSDISECWTACASSFSLLTLRRQ